MENFSGKKFNKITVLEKMSRSKYKCLCECGTVLMIESNRFYKKNSIKSCGCHKKFHNKLIDIKSITPQQYSFRYLFSRYMRGAKNRNVFFDLNFDFFTELVKQKCSYCGIKARPYNCWVGHKTSKNKEEIEQFWIEANGIDRVDNKKGYEEENVVACCKECNYAKRDLSQKQWLAYLNRIFEFIRKSRT